MKGTSQVVSESHLWSHLKVMTLSQRLSSYSTESMSVSATVWMTLLGQAQFEEGCSELFPSGEDENATLKTNEVKNYPWTDAKCQKKAENSNFGIET